MTIPTTCFLPSAPPKSFYRPQPIVTPIPDSPRRPLPKEFPPTASAPPSTNDSFNASTVTAWSSSTSGKTPLSGITPKESSTPTSGRRVILSGELLPSTPFGTVRKRSILLPIHYRFFPKLHFTLCDCRSL